MGPDEFATREELGLVVKLMLAKLDQQSEYIARLISLIQDKGLLTNEEILELAARLKNSERAKKAKAAYEKLFQLGEIRRTARQYLDPPEEAPPTA